MPTPTAIFGAELSLFLIDKIIEFIVSMPKQKVKKNGFEEKNQFQQGVPLCTHLFILVYSCCVGVTFE